MKEKLRFLGMDVHAETIAAAVAEPDGEVRIVAENCPDCCSLCPRQTTKTTTTTNPWKAQVDTVTPYQALSRFETSGEQAAKAIVDGLFQVLFATQITLGR